MMTDYTNSQIRAAIDEYIHNARDREIMKRRLIDGICYEPLAAEYGLSVQRIKSIVYHSQDIIFRHI